MNQFTKTSLSERSQQQLIDNKHITYVSGLNNQPSPTFECSELVHHHKT